LPSTWSERGHPIGTGEITRYIGKYGTKRLKKAVLIGTIGPYLVKAADNPEGVDAKVFDDTRAGLRADRPAALSDFLRANDATSCSAHNNSFPFELSSLQRCSNPKPRTGRARDIACGAGATTTHEHRNHK
jgi:hypothetical protein